MRVPANTRTAFIPALAAFALAALAVALVACGGSSASSTPAIDTAAMEEFSDCMSQHGAELPSGGPPVSGSPPSAAALPSSGQPSAKMQRALQACEQYAPQGGPSGGLPPPGGSSY